MTTFAQVDAPVLAPAPRPSTNAGAGGSGPWRGALEPAVLVVTCVAGAAAVYQPVPLLGVCLLAGLVALVWARPATAGYLLIGLTPLIAGIDRGVAIPFFRPNEALMALLGGTLAARWACRLRSGRVRFGRPDSVEVALLALALTNSVTPLLTMAVREQPITADDLTYSLVLWKLAALYLIVKVSVRTAQQVRICLLLSIAAACVVAVVGILQGLDLLGVRGFLTANYAQFGQATALTTVRGGSTLALPAATADLMILNVAVATAMWLRERRHTVLFGVVLTLLVAATLSAGEFSSTIGLVVGVLVLTLLLRSFALLGGFSVLVAGGLLAAWPVVAVRLEGFSGAAGVPVSWVGRLNNLQSYFWPVLAENWNLVWGVRPSARVAVSTQATGWVWIESGYTWLLWGGGLPLLTAFLFLVVVVARRGWRLGRGRQDPYGTAGTAVVVGIAVIAVLMVFDPHLTYRGSADNFFALLAVTAGAVKRRTEPPADRLPEVEPPRAPRPMAGPGRHRVTA